VGGYTSEDGKTVLMVTPPIEKDFWTHRVKLDNGQAVIGFPKFFTIGIGFAEEQDWNTNLPWSSTAEDIYEHIKHNKKPSKATKATVIKAIKLIQEYVEKAKKEEK
jgi:hypothetical protein